MGNSNGLVDYTIINSPQTITYFSLVNKDVSAATINLTISDGVSEVNIIPNDMQLDTGNEYVISDEIRVLPNFIISLETNKSTDFYCVIE